VVQDSNASVLAARIGLESRLSCPTYVDAVGPARGAGVLAGRPGRVIEVRDPRARILAADVGLQHGLRLLADLDAVVPVGRAGVLTGHARRVATESDADPPILAAGVSLERGAGLIRYGDAVALVADRFALRDDPASRPPHQEPIATMLSPGTAGEAAALESRFATVHNDDIGRVSPTMVEGQIGGRESAAARETHDVGSAVAHQSRGVHPLPHQRQRLLDRQGPRQVMRPCPHLDGCFRPRGCDRILDRSIVPAPVGRHDEGLLNDRLEGTWGPDRRLKRLLTLPHFVFTHVAVSPWFIVV
jgi:hypothetical protein